MTGTAFVKLNFHGASTSKEKSNRNPVSIDK